MAAHSRKDLQMRQRLAQVAAQVMLDSGVQDYQIAKRKAAEKLSAHDTRNLPSNSEIEQALIEQQRLFNSEGHQQVLTKLREAAIDAMHFLEPFKPRLVGDVLTGTADANSRVQLHVFADTVERVGIFLMDRHIPYEEHEHRYRTGPEEYQQFHSYRFIADDVAFELIVFPETRDRKAPLNPVDGKVMSRAGIADVEELLRG